MCARPGAAACLLGNYEAAHRDVPLEEITPILLKPMSAAMYCPSPTAPTSTVPRAGEYRSRRFRSSRRVIDDLTNFVEHPEVVSERLERVAQAVGDPTA